MLPTCWEPAAMTAIVCSDLSFSWPDGARVLSGLTLSIGDGRTGLIGVNGSGKSPPRNLTGGERGPAWGAVRTSPDIGYLPQAITLGTSRTVSDLLGITVARDALHAIEAGENGAAAFAAVGDDWDVEERARAWLDRLGLAGLGLDDRVERLSGGETVGVALTARFLRRPGILLLEEPTSSIDLDARRGRGLDRGDGDRQPRPRTARPGRSHRRPVRCRRPDVRRSPGGLRAAAGGRAGGRAAGGHRGRRRGPPGTAGRGRRAGEAGPARRGGAPGGRAGR